MQQSNPNLHHRRSIRIPGYDYSQEGWYYVTVCAYNKQCLFGKIHNGKMELNSWGKIAYDEWIKTSEMRKNIRLDVFVIMPNHIHGIIVIESRDTMHRAPTTETFGKPTSNSIPTIIRGYKASVTKQINIARNMPMETIWQKNYYEHIIRNEKDLNRIREYIVTNPQRWEDDELYVS